MAILNITNPYPCAYGSKSVVHTEGGKINWPKQIQETEKLGEGIFSVFYVD